MATFISDLTSIVTAVAGYVTTWISTVTAEGNSILLFSMLIPLVGIGIGALKRLLSARV